MKDENEKPAKKMVPRDITPEVIEKMDWADDAALAVAEPEPAPDAVSPVGTHHMNLKKCRRAEKAQ